MVTKRDIYYHDPQLFRRQETVDGYIDDIAFTCKVTRKDLNVTASPKGLYIVGTDPTDTVNAIADSIDCSRLPIKGTKWILIVEKEATSRYLLENAFHRSSRAGPGIIVTGKGYPDLETRRFLKSLSTFLGDDVPMYGLFDADADGLDIWRCYTIGSKRLAQEMETCVSNLRWLGISLDDVDPEDTVPLTNRDRTKTQNMLANSERYQCCQFVDEYHSMLQRILMMNCKAEIQALEDDSNRLVAWLEKKMMNASSAL